MKTREFHSAVRAARCNSFRERASVLIIVLWITFGLVSIALYFGHSMFFEFRAADNNVAGIEAEQAIEGAARYIGYMLTNLVATEVLEPGNIPDPLSYDPEEMPVGEATYWIIGRTNQQVQIDMPSFGLIDEASKLNLNTATLDMLLVLPRMTPQYAAAIIDWRDADSTVSQNGAESETYSRLDPPYQCKNSNFESLDELRLVFGADPDILYGEDYNRNGVLDLNENDADLSPPYDNRDGTLDVGIMEYLTVFSRESNTRTNQEPRIDINSTQTNLTQLLTDKLGQRRATQIQSQLGQGRTYGSVLEYYARSGMTAEEFNQIESDLTTTNATYIEGLINVNTASSAVLACVPGIGPEKAPQIVSARQSKGQGLTGIGWITEVLTDMTSITQAGPYLTSRSYQFTADIAAVGHNGRGYRRTLFVFDTSEGQSKIIYRRDLTRLGWALGTNVRQQLALGTANRLGSGIRLNKF